MKYEINYLFDLGSGVCLWSKNDESRNKFGYAIDHWELPLNENTKRYLQYLIAWYDTSINWSDPSEKSEYWSSEELNHFKIAAIKGLKLLKNELSLNEYEISDETSLT
jgi:hypothetical protein